VYNSESSVTTDRSVGVSALPSVSQPTKDAKDAADSRRIQASVPRLDEAGPHENDRVGILRSERAGSLRPEHAGSLRPERVGSLRPEHAGSLRPERAGSLRLEHAGSLRPEGAGSLRPEGSGARQPDEGVSLESLNDSQLLARADRFARVEHDAGLHLLDALLEIERRSLSLQLGYSSLFDHCTRKWLFSRSKAGRCIAVARATQRYPSLRDLLAQRCLTIGNAATLVGVLTTENSTAVLSRAAGRTYAEIEEIVASLKPAREVRDMVRPIGRTHARERRTSAYPKDAINGPFATEGRDRDVTAERGSATDIHVSGASGIHVSGASGTHVSGASGIHVSGASGIGVSGASGIHVSGASGTHVSGASGTHVSGALGIHVSGASGTHVGGASAKGAQNTGASETGSAGSVAVAETHVSTEAGLTEAGAFPVATRSNGPGDPGSSESVPSNRGAAGAGGTKTAPTGTAPTRTAPREAEIANADSAKLAADDSQTGTRYHVRFSASHEFASKLDRARRILSSRTSLESVFDALLDDFLERHDPERRGARRAARHDRRQEGRSGPRNRRRESECDGQNEDSNEDSNDANRTRQRRGRSRHIPAGIRDAVFARDEGQCTYVGPDGVRCTSAQHLQIDHIVPFSHGGKHTVENLRLLCAGHNRLEANRLLGEQPLLGRRRASLGGGLSLGS